MTAIDPATHRRRSPKRSINGDQSTFSVHAKPSAESSPTSVQVDGPQIVDSHREALDDVDERDDRKRASEVHPYPCRILAIRPESAERARRKVVDAATEAG